MMIDVNPNFGGTDRGQRSTKTILDRGIEGDGNIDIFRIGRRFREQTRARKETIFLEHAIFVPNTNAFAEWFKREAECELASERVPVRANMAKNRKLLVLAQGLADLLELGRAHSCFSLSASICCKISTTRDPRAIDSS